MLCITLSSSVTGRNDSARYNGSCEAGIGSMKTRTHHQSVRGEHAGDWTCADAEAARQEANETARPWGKSDFYKTFHRLIKRVELQKIRLYDLRHSCASMLLAAGASMFELRMSYT